MCGQDFSLEYDAPLAPEHHTLSRRRFLAGVGGAAGAFLMPGNATAAAASAAASGPSLTGASPLLTAMHVHASWSEGLASWESQFVQADALGVDLMYMTDHDFRALAYKFITSLDKTQMTPTSSGSLAQHAATMSGPTLHLLAESADSAPATVTSSVEERHVAWNQLRTSIAGHTLRHTCVRSRLDAGATYEMRVQLSYHPETGGGRPASTTSGTGSGSSPPAGS